MNIPVPSDLQVIIEYLREWAMPDSTPPRLGHGICYNLDIAMHQADSDGPVGSIAVVNALPELGMHRTYPIESQLVPPLIDPALPDDITDHDDQIMILYEQLGHWTGVRGKLRRELCTTLADHFERML